MTHSQLDSNYDWGKELIELLEDDPCLSYGAVNWLECKAMIFNSHGHIGDIGYLPLSGCHYFLLPSQSCHSMNKVPTMLEAIDALDILS